MTKKEIRKLGKHELESALYIMNMLELLGYKNLENLIDLRTEYVRRNKKRKGKNAKTA